MRTQLNARSSPLSQRKLPGNDQHSIPAQTDSPARAPTRHQSQKFQLRNAHANSRSRTPFFFFELNLGLDMVEACLRERASAILGIPLGEVFFQLTQSERAKRPTL
jgi:hypothetical protein